MAVKAKLTKESYLEAVRKYRTTINNELASKLGVHRSSIGRFLTKNPKVQTEALKILDNIERIQFNETSIMDIEIFMTIPIVAEWIEILGRKKVKAKGARDRAFSLMRVCNALGVHPSKLDLDHVADNVAKWKLAGEKKLPYPRGCAYNTVRVALRSFMTIMLSVTAEQLTIKGIGAEHSAGFAKSAREKIDIDERLDILDTMRESVKQIFDEKNINQVEYPLDDYVLEMMGVCFFMYYSATRIEATLASTLNDSRNVFKLGYYEIGITDKGKGSRLEWQKRFIDNGYTVLSLYIRERFGIPIEVQPKMLKSMDSLLFPLLNKDYQLECAVMKRVQVLTGSYKIVQMNHLWRHTFAQDWLHAMDGNYEVGAEIGGWKDIGTMKRCYGAVSEHIIQKGLKKAMGIKVEDEEFELRFVAKEHDTHVEALIVGRGVA